MLLIDRQEYVRYFLSIFLYINITLSNLVFYDKNCVFAFIYKVNDNNKFNKIQPFSALKNYLDYSTRLNIYIILYISIDFQQFNNKHNHFIVISRFNL